MSARARAPGRVLVSTLAVVLALLGAGPAAGEDGSLDDMRRQLKAMQAQIEALQETVQKQQELIENLGSVPPPPATPVAAAEAPPAAMPTPAGPPPPPAVAEVPAWSPDKPFTLLKGPRWYVNFSADAIVDAGWSTTSDVTEIEPGDHDPNQRGFSLPNEEFVVEGAVDPYFKAVLDVVLKLDENNETNVELEEAYLLTSSLPWNLQVKGGEFLTEFGRINQQHPHAWDFVDQPLVINRMFGPDGLRNPGARLGWLLPTPFYSEVFVAVQDSQGEAAYSFRNPDTPLFGRLPVDNTVASLGDMLYVPRYAAAFDLTDAQTLVVGVSGAFGPNDAGHDTTTQIYGGDVFWKWKPAWQSGGFPFVALQGEVLGRRFEAGPVYDGTYEVLPAQNLYDWGFYAQQVYGFTRRWVAGLRQEWVGGDRPTPNQGTRFRLSPDLTFYPTEFSKIRLQYNFDHQQEPYGDDSSVWMQFEVLLGDHAAHKF